MINNIPAFPATHYDLAEGEHGLTMRDYFAAKTLQSLIIGKNASSLTGGGCMAASMLSYEMADAMMKARDL
jgi:hypothetical protein